MKKSDFINLIVETIHEDPDQVVGPDGDVRADAGLPGSIAFIVVDMDGKVIHFAGRRYHTDIRSEMWQQFPDISPNQQVIVGRIWPNQRICSIYQDKTAYIKYSGAVENMFRELKLNIDKFGFEYGSSSEKMGLIPWNRIKSGKLSKSKLDPYTENRLTQEFNTILQTFHLLDPVKKRESRNRLEVLRKALGKSEGDVEAALMSSLDRAAEKERGFGSIAKSNYYKGAIAEFKVRLYNPTLCPKLWDGGMVLKPDVRKSLLTIANDFHKQSDIKNIPIKDVYFLGSAAGFNYNEDSDIDLHIIIDMKQIGIPQEYTKKFGKSITSKWNLDHDVKIGGHKVEIYVQDVGDKNRASGIYSVCKNLWIRIPQKMDIRFDVDGIKKMYLDLTKKIKLVIKTGDHDKMVELFKKIMDIRERGLSSCGEFSTENLTFKILRSRGWIKKLKDSSNKSFDDSVSINEDEKVVVDPKLIWFGTVDDDLMVKGYRLDRKPKGHGDFGVKMTGWFWRYRVDLNVLFIWKTELMWSDDMKTSVIEWLESNVGANKPQIKMIVPGEYWRYKTDPNLNPKNSSYYLSHGYADESLKSDGKIFLGDCRDDSLVEDIFGTVSEFARLIERHGNSFKYNGVLVTYDENTDTHSFWK